MRRTPLKTAASATAPRLRWLGGALLLLAGAALMNRAEASSGLCTTGHCSVAPLAEAAAPERSLLEFASKHRLPGSMDRSDELSGQEYFSFSGVGAIVCTVDGERRMSTAFLVGAFDIGVTVAHTFDSSGAPVAPENCIYTSTDSLGQIRERIPVVSIKSQWSAEAGAAGQVAKDLAVIRLAAPSNYAQRTMPIGRFSGAPAPVLLVGLRDDIESNPLKAKSRGTAYDRKANGVSLASLEGFTHDIDASHIAAGAPVIDERTGIIIGIHTRSVPRTGARRNTLITMNEWLETTLRAEIQAGDEKGANSRF